MAKLLRVDLKRIAAELFSERELVEHVLDIECCRQRRFEATQGKGAWVRVVMGEGRKRQIREICKQLGLPIVRILRIRIGSLRLGNLKPRHWRHLTLDEVEALKGNPTQPSRRTQSRSKQRH